MKDIMKKAAELARIMTKYKLTEEDVQNIIDLHDGDVKKAIRTIETAQKTIRAFN